jgi:hypothetical protein
MPFHTLQSAITRWGATAALILPLMLLRSLSLCVVAMLGLAAFLESTPIGQFFARWAVAARHLPDIRRG